MSRKECRDIYGLINSVRPHHCGHAASARGRPRHHPARRRKSLLPTGHSSILLRDAWRRLRRATMGARAVGCSLASARPALAAVVLASATIVGMCGSAEARLVRINTDKRAVVDLPAFGATGASLKISGTLSR